MRTQSGSSSCADTIREEHIIREQQLSGHSRGAAAKLTQAHSSMQLKRARISSWVGVKENKGTGSENT